MKYPVAETNAVVVFGVESSRSESHTLAFAFRWDASRSLCIVDIDMVFWHGDNDPTDSGNCRRAVELRPCIDEDMTEKIFWCDCGLGVEVSLLPSWQDIGEVDHVIELTLDVIIAHRSEFVNVNTKLVMKSNKCRRGLPCCYGFD